MCYDSVTTLTGKGEADGLVQEGSGAEVVHIHVEHGLASIRLSGQLCRKTNTASKTEDPVSKVLCWDVFPESSSADDLQPDLPGEVCMAATAVAAVRWAHTCKDATCFKKLQLSTLVLHMQNRI
jgi:hypothetical protein